MTKQDFFFQNKELLKACFEQREGTARAIAQKTGNFQPSRLFSGVPRPKTVEKFMLPMVEQFEADIESAKKEVEIKTKFILSFRQKVHG